MKVEVLVATINQTDLSLFEKMNIQTDVIFCNQCDRNEFIETEINGCRVRMLSTTTRGVGVNRNFAMQLSDADICLFADDDVVYFDDYEKTIINAFNEYLKSDMIAFNVKESRDGKVFKDIINKSGKAGHMYGTYCLGIKNKSIKQKNINFSRMFGGGTIYSCGEDSLFCREVIKNGEFYQYATCIGTVNHGPSTWFNGYNEKYYFDRGALCKAMYPTMWRLLKYYLVVKLGRKSSFSLFKVAKLMNQGAKAYIKGMSYNEWCTNEK